ncbi:SMI1/KNR4 family protein [Achromobacter kerstersii]|jgi:hypothetical protein|uniref:SMI1/KNR4 family protein n=1 Tax=Achromobacter kerstersii TaxID=1353890 RepID=UPI0032096EB2
MHSYPALAQAHGIPLPALLRHLIEAGLADYGADVKAWVADWRANKLAAQPALSCIDDFEWIKADEAAETIDEWLNPAYQHGRRFLPFAQTGAGDAYCLTPLSNGGVGVALVWHDADTSKIEAVSFDVFAYEAVVRSAGDASHLIDDGFSRAEAAQCVAANLRAVAPSLPQDLRAELDGIARLLTGSDGQADGPALVPAAAVDAALARVPAVQDAPFVVVARWECGEG